MRIRSLIVGSSTSIVTLLSRFTRSDCICGWMFSSRLLTYHSSSSSIANGKGMITIILHVDSIMYCLCVLRFSRFSNMGIICLLVLLVC